MHLVHELKNTELCGTRPTWLSFYCIVFHIDWNLACFIYGCNLLHQHFEREVAVSMTNRVQVFGEYPMATALTEGERNGENGGEAGRNEELISLKCHVGIGGGWMQVEIRKKEK